MAKKRKNPAHGQRRPKRSLLDDFIDDLFGVFSGPNPDELPPSPRVSISPLTPEENALYGEVVKLGFRKALETYHPDRGGDPDKMAKLNALRDKVFQIAGIKK